LVVASPITVASDAMPAFSPLKESPKTCLARRSDGKTPAEVTGTDLNILQAILKTQLRLMREKSPVRNNLPEIILRPGK
jgi:hypothetical protein